MTHYCDRLVVRISYAAAARVRVPHCRSCKGLYQGTRAMYGLVEMQIGDHHTCDLTADARQTSSRYTVEVSCGEFHMFHRSSLTGMRRIVGDPKLAEWHSRGRLTHHKRTSPSDLVFCSGPSVCLASTPSTE